jgi:oligoribonuclease NrnB/cAMP/cGMP phosphodiesterase (DHH superfamily)
MNFDTIISHKNCPDGQSSAWIYKHYLTTNKIDTTNINFFEVPPAVKYDTDYKNKTILMLDVCYTKKDLLDVASEAKSITILDHHVSNKEIISECKNDNITAVFDMKRCGAQITWDYFFPNTERPKFIEHIADRDLWKWEFDDSKAICEYMYSNNMYNDTDFTKMLSFNKNDYSQMASDGNVSLKIKQNIINNIAKTALLTDFVCPNKKKYKVFLVNCLHDFVSDVGALLAKKKECDFVACYRLNFTTKEWFISLRSFHPHIDLTEITKLFPNGGGHKCAAGLTLTGDLYNYFSLSS